MKKRCASGHVYDYKETHCPICFKDRDKYRERNDHVYNYSWKKFRKNLNQDVMFSFCWLCFLEKNKFVFKTHLHHIFNVIDYPELKFSVNNLSCVCGSCHNKIEAKIRKGEEQPNWKEIKKKVREKLTELGNP